MERLTNISMSRNVLANNQSTLGRIAKLQEQLSTGKRINRVSDDPLAARQSLRLHAETMKTDKYVDNIGKSLSLLQASDSAFGQIVDAIGAVKKLAVQGANGTEDANSRATLAASVDAQLKRLVDVANTAHDGRYLFAGTDNQQPPFESTDDAVDYHGSLDHVEIQIAPGTNERIDQNGFTLFKDEVDVFAALIQIRDALLDNDPDAIGALIDTVDEAHSLVNNAHGALGAQVQRLELTRNQLADAKMNLGRLLSDIEDADLPGTIADLQLSMTALEAGLNVGARVLPRSLLDYL